MRMAELELRFHQGPRADEEANTIDDNEYLHVIELDGRAYSSALASGCVRVRVVSGVLHA